MTKRIKQYRYYGDGNENNYPSGLSKVQLITGAAFETNICDLKIMSRPGTKFYLNQSTDPIIIGMNGLYDIHLSGNYEITALRFDVENTIFNNDPPDNHDLIVDIVYIAED